MSQLKRSRPYWSNPPFFIFFFDIRTLWRLGLSARVPVSLCQNVKSRGLDQYGGGPERFEV